MISVDSEGIVPWSSNIVPFYWVIEQCFEDGTSGNNTCYFPGEIGMYAAHGAGWPGGLNFKVWGCDEYYNIIIDPFISIDKSKFQ